MPLHPHHQEPALTGVTITAAGFVARHFIHDASVLVDSALQSVALTNPSVSVDIKNRIAYLDVDHPPQVSIISGGGSGHEPSFAGFVGRGLLTAAASGPVLTSPKPAQVEAAISRVNSEDGILAIIMNQQGDVDTFKTAISKARASGLKAELVIVGDDVSGGRIKALKHGRSGIAGTVLVLKIAGALAASGAPLSDVTRIATLAATNIVSLGVTLSQAQIPNHPLSDAASDDLLTTERVGFSPDLPLLREAHPTPGSHRSDIDLPLIVTGMLKELLDWSDEDRAFLEADAADEHEPVVLLVNNLGGISGLEFAGITLEVARQLQDTYGIVPVRVFAGTYMSSLNELGFSISLLRVGEWAEGLGLRLGGGEGSVLDLLDAPTETVGWWSGISKGTWGRREVVPPAPAPAPEI